MANEYPAGDRPTPEEERLKTASGMNSLSCYDGTPRFIPGDRVSYIRGRAWQELGQYRVALKFFDNASRLKPGHAPYRILVLECLKAACDWQEAINRANQYSLDPAAPPSLLFRAGDVFHAYLMADGENQEQLAQKAVDLVNAGFDRLTLLCAEAPLDSTLAAAYFTKAYCLECVGKFNEALLTYDDALRRFSTNPEIFTARGLLRLEHRMGDPIDDFRNAVEKSAQTVWPYLELPEIIIINTSTRTRLIYAGWGFQRQLGTRMRPCCSIFWLLHSSI